MNQHPTFCSATQSEVRNSLIQFFANQRPPKPSVSHRLLYLGQFSYDFNITHQCNRRDSRTGTLSLISRWPPTIPRKYNLLIFLNLYPLLNSTILLYRITGGRPTITRMKMKGIGGERFQIWGETQPQTVARSDTRAHLLYRAPHHPSQRPTCRRDQNSYYFRSYSLTGYCTFCIMRRIYQSQLTDPRAKRNPAPPKPSYVIPELLLN